MCFIGVAKLNKSYKYSMVRIVCNGTIHGCDHCKNNKEISEGYCHLCGRPLWKKVGEKCNVILGYHDRSVNTQGKVSVKCKWCNSIQTF